MLYLRTTIVCFSFVAISFSLRVSAAEKHALLVGVSKYPNLGEELQLKGPANDMLLMKDVLKPYGFDFDSANCVELSEAAGGENRDLLPTRANIQREITAIADRVSKGDVVVIYFSGHGSQQPQSLNDDEPEQDGLDQIFLPRDIGKWRESDSQQGVENSIVDNEIREWLNAIRSKESLIWAIFDCCHAGDITRGLYERQRSAPTGEDGLQIPEEKIEAAKKAVAASSVPLSAFSLERQNGMAVLYACQRHEKAIEKSLGGKPCGILTFAISAALAKDSSLSYAELGKQIHYEYLKLGYSNGPTPLIEGGDLNRFVLGAKEKPVHSFTVSINQNGDLSVDMGRLHSVSQGAILAVYDSSRRKKSELRGYVRIASAGIATSVVEPCEYKGASPADPESLESKFCEVEELNYGRLQLSVAVDTKDAGGDALSIDSLSYLRELLKGAAASENLIHIADIPADAQWVLQLNGRQVQLVPATEWAHDLKKNESIEFSQTVQLFQADSDQPGDRQISACATSLKMIARASNVLQLAAYSASAPSGFDSFEVAFDLDIRKLKDRLDPDGEAVAFPVAAVDGDRFGYEVTNNGLSTFDLTLLYIDKDFGITCLFPEVGENNRFSPSDVRRLPATITRSKDSGREYLIAIAVDNKGGQPSNLALLAQPSISKFRAASQQSSALGNLLETNMYGVGKSKSANRESFRSFRITAIPFQVSPRSSK